MISSLEIESKKLICNLPNRTFSGDYAFGIVETPSCVQVFRESVNWSIRKIQNSLANFVIFVRSQDRFADATSLDEKSVGAHIVRIFPVLIDPVLKRLILICARFVLRASIP
jgi:hypothetical protein